MCKGNEAGLLQDVVNGNPILTGRFHADFLTVILLKPKRQFPESFGKG
jgi:hypothetical protein